MIRNLETADHIVKLVLAAATVALYVSGVISGPFAVALVVLAIIILVFFAAGMLYKRFFQRRDRRAKAVRRNVVR